METRRLYHIEKQTFSKVLNFGKDFKFLKNPEGILPFGHETFSKVLDFGKDFKTIKYHLRKKNIGLKKQDSFILLESRPFPKFWTLEKIFKTIEY